MKPGGLVFLLLSLFLVSATASHADGVWDIDPAEKAEITAPATIVVYRSPNCNCCQKWMAHLSNNGFVVEDRPMYKMNEIKQYLGIDRKLASCHTAQVGDYVIEGHVPAKDILRLLKEKPAIAGLSVPGMPHGTPGMEGSGRRDKFAVIAFDKAGNKKNWAEYSDY